MIKEIVIEKEVKKIGNSGHVLLPKELIGKKVKIVLESHDPNSEKSESSREKTPDNRSVIDCSDPLNVPRR